MSDSDQVVLAGVLTGAGMIAGGWFGFSRIVLLALVLLFLAFCHIPAAVIAEVAFWAMLTILACWVLLHLCWMIQGLVWAAAAGVIVYFLVQHRSKVK